MAETPQRAEAERIALPARSPAIDAQAIDLLREIGCGYDGEMIVRVAQFLQRALLAERERCTKPEPSAAGVLEWLKSRPGTSWVATINDLERAIAAIRQQPSQEGQ